MKSPFMRYRRVFDIISKDAILAAQLSTANQPVAKPTGEKELFPKEVLAITERLAEEGTDAQHASRPQIIQLAAEILGIFKRPVNGLIKRPPAAPAPAPALKLAPIKAKVPVKVISPVKAKRGRPRKVLAPAALAPASVSVSVPAPVKRGRGRPRKTVVAAPPVAPPAAKVNTKKAPVKALKPEAKPTEVVTLPSIIVSANTTQLMNLAPRPDVVAPAPVVPNVPGVPPDWYPRVLIPHSTVMSLLMFALQIVEHHDRLDGYKERIQQLSALADVYTKLKLIDYPKDAPVAVLAQNSDQPFEKSEETTSPPGPAVV